MLTYNSNLVVMSFSFISKNRELAELKREIIRLKFELDNCAYKKIVLESEDKFAAVFHSNPVALVLSEKVTGKIIDANYSYLTLIQRTREEVIGTTTPMLNIFADPKDRDRIIEKLKKDKRVLNYEIKLRRKSGEVCTSLISVEQLPRHFGETLLTTIQDISARKQVEEELKRNKEQYELLLESANSVIIRWNTAGNITYVNTYGLNLFGYTKDQMVGNPVAMIVPDIESTGRNLTGLTDEIIRNPAKYAHNENENIRRNGEKLWISWTNRAITDDKGNVIEMLAIGNDITEIKRAEETLRANEATMEAFFDSSPVLLGILDNQMKFIKASPVFAGLDQLTVVGKSIFDLDQPFGSKTLKPLLKEVLETGKPIGNFLIESKTSKPNETGYWSVSFFRVPLPGGKTGLGMIGMDVSDAKRNEKLLRRERELFESIFNNIPVMISLFDPELKSFKLNKEFRNTLGWTEQDACEGDFMTRLYPDPDYRFQVLKYMKSMQQGWKEFQVTAKNGELIDSSWAILRLASGISILIGIDLRQRKEVEYSLRKNEKRLQGIFNNAAIGIVEVDADERFVSVNDRLCKILGYSREELLKKRISEMIVPDERRKSGTIKERLFRGDFDIFDYDTQYRKRNGEPLWVHVSVTALKNALGQRINYIGIVEDISVRKKFEDELLESERRFRLLADNISQMVWIMDNKGKPIWFNKRWIDYTGLDVKEAQANILAANHPDFKHVFDNFQESMQRGDAWEGTYTMRNREGQYRWFLSRAVPVYDKENNITFWFGTSTDIHDQKTAEEKARSIALEIEAILSCIPDGVIVYDANGKIVRSNEAADSIMHFTPEEKSMTISERISRSWQLFTEDGRKLSYNETPAYRSAINAETVENEILLIKGPSQSRWYLFNSAPLVISGKHEGGVLSMLDISHRKKMEEQHKENEQRLQGIFNNVAIGIAEIDAQEKFIEVNDRICELLGYTREELLEMTVLDITAPEDHALTSEKINILRNGNSNILTYEKRYVRHNGERIWVNVTISAIRDIHGNYVRTIGTIEDITERKLAEEAFIRSETILRKAGILSNMGAWEIEFVNPGDVMNNPGYWSEQVFRIFGYEPGSVKVTNELFFEIVHPEDRQMIINTFQKAMTEKTPFLVEHRIIRKDGIERNVIEHADFTYDQQGNPLRVIGAIQDVTEQNRIQREMHLRNEELTRFIYTVSHDLKSPLVTIKMFCSYLKDDFTNQDTDSFSQDLGYIENAADKMGHLLNELLELSRIGRKEAAKTEIPLEEVVRTVTDLLAGRIKEKNARINITAPHIILYGYAQRFIQLYQNLIDNALKFTGRQDNPVIEIGAIIDMNNDIVLFVRDNGSGIDPRYHHKIFGLFEKLDSTVEGTGIGLALVKRIVEVHGGQIWFTSEGNDQGTTFYFTFRNTRLLTYDI